MTKANRLDSLLTALQSLDWADYSQARQTLTALGGEAAEALGRIAAAETHPLKSTAMELLTSIEQETTYRLAGRLGQLLCPRCLTRFGAHPVELAWGISFTYYGCRVCSQSREFFEAAQVVVVLDARWTKVLSRRQERLRLNWLRRRVVFDFDWVEIKQASDEDVERFAVQVGNDTDPVRQPRYSELPCFIAATCRLSPNTLRILEHTFGVVEQKKAVK
jgi:hypothetical protein